MIYLLILIIVLQIAQLYILFPKIGKPNLIITSKSGTAFVTKDKTVETKRVVLCPICNKEVIGKIIRRRDGLFGCDQCSRELAG